MKNFGKIKNNINSLLSESIVGKTNTNKTLFKYYLKELKGDKILGEMFKVYESIETLCEVDQFKASEKIKSHISRLDKYPLNDIRESNLRLNKSIGESNSGDYKYESIDGLITNLIFSRGDVDSYVDNLSEAIEYVKVNTINETKDIDVYPNSVLSSMVVDKFNDKYSDLNESDKQTILSIRALDEDTRKDIFGRVVVECIDTVNIKLDNNENSDIKESLLSVKDKLLRMKYDTNIYIENITKLYQLKQNLN